MPYKGSRPFQGRFFMAVTSLFLCFTGMQALCAQKQLLRTFDSGLLTKVYIDADKVFEVILEEHHGKELEVEVNIEGEYQNEMLLGTQREGSTLYLKGVFSPSFEDPNDKLSAHKVLSVRLKLRVPRHLNVELTGLSTRVVASGYFDDLSIQTDKGPVFLNRPEGVVKARTMGGVIRVREFEGFASATSSYGRVIRGAVSKGMASLVLRSVNGDIYINKEE